MKAHGARNDFLLTWAHEAPAEPWLHRVAQALCDRHGGVGADGWLLVSPPLQNSPARIRLFNPDGGEVEISGNGTRCAAAFLTDAALVGDRFSIATGAGEKQITFLRRSGLEFYFEMNMGTPLVLSPRYRIALREGTREAVLLDVGNPQCAFFVDHFDFDWKALGAEVESHPDFPRRTNVSFIRPVDRHTLEVRFFERGAGFTLSSGTGSTGAVAAALAHGLLDLPASVLTLAGPLEFRRQNGDLIMAGPAMIVAGGEFYLEA